MVDCHDCQHFIEEGHYELCGLRLHMTLAADFFDRDKHCKDYIGFTDETPDEGGE